MLRRGTLEKTKVQHDSHSGVRIYYILTQQLLDADVDLCPRADASGRGGRGVWELLETATPIGTRGAI